MNNPHKVAGDHRRVWDVIPWVVNGSASAAEQRLVDEHVQVCADCRSELARQRSVQTAVAQAVAPVTDVDAGLKRLFKRIDETTDHRIASVPGGLARRGWQRMGTINHWLAAAVIVEAVGLSALGMGLMLRSAPEHEYQTLSESAAAPKRATLLIVPAPSMQLGELQHQLHALNLTVVSGPTAVGAYALAPHSDQPSQEAQIASLRAVPGMRLVEPIAAVEGKSR
jgi:anti-sigma factor RsiW